MQYQLTYENIQRLISLPYMSVILNNLRRFTVERFPLELGLDEESESVGVLKIGDNIDIIIMSRTPKEQIVDNLGKVFTNVSDYPVRRLEYWRVNYGKLLRPKDFNSIAVSYYQKHYSLLKSEEWQLGDKLLYEQSGVIDGRTILNDRILDHPRLLSGVAWSNVESLSKVDNLVMDRISILYELASQVAQNEKLDNSQLEKSAITNHGFKEFPVMIDSATRMLALKKEASWDFLIK